MAHNRFSFIGNLTKPPELRQTGAGKSVATISIAVNRVFGQGEARQERADFFRITAWDKAADNASQFLNTGNKIFVEGRIETGSYEKDGAKHYTTDFIAEKIEYLGGKPSGQTGQGTDEGQGHDEDLSRSFE